MLFFENSTVDDARLYDGAKQAPVRLRKVDHRTLNPADRVQPPDGRRSSGELGGHAGPPNRRNGVGARELFGTGTTNSTPGRDGEGDGPLPARHAVVAQW